MKKEIEKKKFATLIINYLSNSFRIRNKTCFRVVDMSSKNFPSVKVQVINKRSWFTASVHDLIHSGDITNFSTLDVILITYIATLDEMESCSIEMPEMKVEGIKQDDNGIKYCVKDLKTETISYYSASELRKARGFLSLPKQDISNISYYAGYDDAWKKSEALRIINNDIKIEIKDVTISVDNVEMRVLRKRDNKIIDMDITEVLFKRDNFSKEDNYILGKLNALREMNSFGHKQ